MSIKEDLKKKPNLNKTPQLLKYPYRLFQSRIPTLSLLQPQTQTTLVVVQSTIKRRATFDSTRFLFFIVVVEGGDIKRRLASTRLALTYL